MFLLPPYIYLNIYSYQYGLTYVHLILCLVAHFVSNLSLCPVPALL